MNSWFCNDVAYFTFDALVFPVAVKTTRDLSPGGYSLPLVRYQFSLRRKISPPDGSRARYVLPNSEASSSSAASLVIYEIIEVYLVGALLRPWGDYVFIHACNLLPIWRDILEMVTPFLVPECRISENTPHQKNSILFFKPACTHRYRSRYVRLLPSNIPSTYSSLCDSFWLLKVLVFILYTHSSSLDT